MQRFDSPAGHPYMKFFTLLFPVMVGFLSCTKQSSSQSGNLRIYNNSTFQYDSVIVNSPGGKQVYYNVAAGSYSGYKKFEFLYRYAYIEVHYNNQVSRLQPFDYVGEEKFVTGKYSYLIGIATATPATLTLECKRD
ncbi:hypothetical protein ESA94_18775 [Lacibacter luteus]|uniref:DUF4397 domain-containing protein n=1 Tax=Lacibacter luteus TaxID=2508719 RepID=A0A4Q1CE62_9BACT|nr:hypothetical protein [Lacibacter luteus]RXK58059.1 hypothetical protein ESA94_18775 [Lacibacter luteus]